MLNLTRIMIVSIILFGSTNLFAQSQIMPATKSEFSKMDTNQDGFVTLNEMQAYQAQTFKDLDKNNSHDLDAQELKADQTDMHKLTAKTIASKGKITQEESVSQFSEYFKQMDKNQDGKISEAEYTDYWKLIYKF